MELVLLELFWYTACPWYRSGQESVDSVIHVSRDLERAYRCTIDSELSTIRYLVKIPTFEQFMLLDLNRLFNPTWHIHSILKHTRNQPVIHALVLHFHQKL